MSAPNPTEVRATLVTLIAGATATRAARWEKLRRQVEMLPIVFNPRCNWRVKVSGSTDDRDVIEKAIKPVRVNIPT